MLARVDRVWRIQAVTLRGGLPAGAVDAPQALAGGDHVGRADDMRADAGGRGASVADLLAGQMRLMLPLGTLHALAGARPVRLAIALMVSPLETRRSTRRRCSRTRCPRIRRGRLTMAMTSV